MSAVISRSPVRSLEVLDAFRIAREPLSVSEIARLARLPLSTCHGLVRALEHHGFLHFLTTRKVYPTRRLWDMAVVIDAHDPLTRRVTPALEALRDATGETVILGTRQHERVLYLQVVESRHAIRYSSRAGEHKPLHSSAIGKCLLSTLNADELESWLKAQPLPRITDTTVTDAQMLRLDLAEGRKLGRQVTRGENVADVMAVAAPLLLGTLTLALAVAGPMHRMVAAERRVTEALLTCVQQLSPNDGIDHTPMESEHG